VVTDLGPSLEGSYSRCLPPDVMTAIKGCSAFRLPAGLHGKHCMHSPVEDAEFFPPPEVATVDAQVETPAAVTESDPGVAQPEQNLAETVAAAIGQEVAIPRTWCRMVAAALLACHNSLCVKRGFRPLVAVASNPSDAPPSPGGLAGHWTCVQERAGRIPRPASPIVPGAF
jgi:hypothetical protein